MFAKRNFDPELEELRNEVEGPPNLDTVALNFQRATRRIHASYLFEHIGKPTLQQLCLLLSSTAAGRSYSGWQEFAAHMDLSMEQIRCIEYDFRGLQDPTYYVLLTYVQHAEATIDKILSALQKMHRFDVINRIKDNIADLIKEILKNTNANESDILKPKSTPRVPLVLSPPINFIEQVKEREVDSGHVTEDNVQRLQMPKQVQYGSIVMLTFAKDGLETAQRIAKVFRSKQPRIGVLILEEHNNSVHSNPEEFIDNYSRQVKFIIPILTQGYIERINNPRKIYIEDQTNLDFKYINYIYSLLRYEYVKNQCMNHRIRCIVPDKEVQVIIKADLHLTLQAWFRESDIDAFIDNILLEKCSR